MGNRSWRGLAGATLVGSLGAALLLLGGDPLGGSAGPVASIALPPAPPPGADPDRPPLPSFSPAAELLGRPEQARVPKAQKIRTNGGIRILPLEEARGWMEALYAVWRATRSGSSPAKLETYLEKALEKATAEVSRQNVIFLMALHLPPEAAERALRRIEAMGSAGDAEDALVALAFSGDDDALRRFEALARLPSEARPPDEKWRVGAHEERAIASPPGTRALLRSYRAIEVLDRRAYFWGTYTQARTRAWLPHPAHTAALSRRCRRAWLARYPGHQGSDDQAFRIALSYTWEDAPLERARWLLRASVLPDQDTTHGALNRLLRACETRLERSDIARLVGDWEVGGFNRALLQYLFVRRTAAEVGFQDAITEVSRMAAMEPHGQIAEAWRRRESQPPAGGLRSGLEPLPARDDLLRQSSAPPQEDSFRDRAPKPPARIGGAFSSSDYRGRETQWCLDPPDDVLVPHTNAFARQFRLWETLAELERRTAAADTTARADLLYKQAAVFYHEPHVLFPAYAKVSAYHRWYLGIEDTPTDPDGIFEGVHPYESRNYSLLRALALFDRIEREHPGYAGLDKVVFSKAMAWKKLIAYWPFDARASHTERHLELIRRLVATFERVPREFPSSPLADDATHAAAWWRTHRSNAWK